MGVYSPNREFVVLAHLLLPLADSEASASDKSAPLATQSPAPGATPPRTGPCPTLDRFAVIGGAALPITSPPAQTGGGGEAPRLLEGGTSGSVCRGMEMAGGTIRV